MFHDSIFKNTFIVLILFPYSFLLIPSLHPPLKHPVPSHGLFFSVLYTDMKTKIHIFYSFI